MLYALVFVLATESDLPQAPANWQALEDAQRQGLLSGTQLRLFRVPEGCKDNLSALLAAGAVKATGEIPFPPGKTSPLLCDAMVPTMDPRRLWLGVYQVAGRTPSQVSAPGLKLEVESVVCLDRYPLQEAANETCWFYPTDNGRYLAWENRKRIETFPGHLPDRPPQPTPFPYSHGDVHVLWSLMADDLALTCVGLTYRRQRIEWPVVAEVQESLSTWTEFQVDSMAETSYVELNSATVFRSEPNQV